jgi:phage shock protein C
MNTSYKRLTRSSTHRMLTGLCGGIGEYFNIDPTIVRLLFVLGFFAGLHFGIVIAYVIMALIIPEATPEAVVKQNE